MHYKLLASRNSMFALLLSLLCACTAKKTDVEVKLQQSAVDSVAIPYEVSTDKSSLQELYQLDHMKEWYPERVQPPTFDFSVDVSRKSITELWLLRNEILARNGYLFDDAVLRGYFDQFKWYQPVFDVPDFKVNLSPEELEFINRIIARENQLKAGRYADADGYSMINIDHIYNRVQFKSIPAALDKQLARLNFAIVPAKHEQLFHVYDKNHYEYIPSFVTTDLYLQVLHKHFSSLLRRVEENKFTPLLTGLLEQMSQKAIEFEKANTDSRWNKPADWVATYLAIANTLITGKEISMPGQYRDEVDKILRGEGQGSQFLEDDYIQYSQFIPRGNYTKSPELQRYFRCIKWLNTAAIHFESDDELLRAVLMAMLITQSRESEDAFNKFNTAIRFIVGDEDNLSLAHVMQNLDANETKNFSALGTTRLNTLREKLLDLNPDKIRAIGASKEAEAQLALPSILFTAGRYTFDAEMLSRLVHVLQPSPHRPFPKGLDVFAALGNIQAEDILLTEYREQEKWDGYEASLSKLQAEFQNYPDWSKNIYNKTMETIKSVAAHTDARDPLFSKTPMWARKNLSTALASWTELKHDMLLYSEQPYAAQAGEGGGPPPPQHIAYVEPNITFWKNALALIDFQEKTLESQNLLDEDIKSINSELREIGTFLLTTSEKELNHEFLNAHDFDELSWIGGKIEYLTFRIFDSDHLPEKERLVALTADVYRFNNDYLIEATGLADEIYVVAEINGKPYLTRGAVFSYYEFTNTSPLTDEQWQGKLLRADNVPPRPKWLEQIFVKAPSLESKAEYGLLGSY